MPSLAAIRTFDDVLGKFCEAANWFFVFFLVAAVIFIILTAFSYLTAAGDPQKLQKAKHRLMYAIVAIVVALMSMAIPKLIGSVLDETVTICGS